MIYIKANIKLFNISYKKMNASANFALILVEHMYKLNIGMTLKHLLIDFIDTFV